MSPLHSNTQFLSTQWFVVIELTQKTLPFEFLDQHCPSGMSAQLLQLKVGDFIWFPERTVEWHNISGSLKCYLYSSNNWRK
jgi:hypothetical protein